MDKNGSDQLKLARGYTLWFSGLVPKEDAEDERDMKHIMEPIADIDTVEEFWAVYQHLLKPNETNSKTCYHLFQKGIKPVWEDEANKEGGRWHIWLPKGQTNKLWEDLLLYLIGNQFSNGDSVCGVEVRTKPRGDSLSIWHKSSENEEEKDKVRDEFLAALGATDKGLKVEYHKFTESLAFEKQHKSKKQIGFARKGREDSNKHE